MHDMHKSHADFTAFLSASFLFHTSIKVLEAFDFSIFHFSWSPSGGPPMISSDTLTHLSLPGNCIIIREVDRRVGEKKRVKAVLQGTFDIRGGRSKTFDGRADSAWNFPNDCQWLQSENPPVGTLRWMLSVHTDLAVAQRIRDPYPPKSCLIALDSASR